LVSIDENPLGSVYWKFHENFFISLTGKVLKFTEGDKISISSRVLEENSAKNLMKLFTCESISSATNSPNDPLRSLVESLVRLGQIGIEKQIELERNNDSHHEHHQTRIYEIYFQNSVIIGGKKEYPLYIIKAENLELEELLNSLENSSSFDEKSNILQEFYLKNLDDSIELEIFNQPKIYESFLEPMENIEKMIKSLKSDGIKLKDLTSEDQEDVDLKDIEIIFNEILSTKIPTEKLANLVKLHSTLTQKQPATNADILLPLLTYALIYLENGHEIGGQVKFIERFIHPNSLTGLNNYILTSTVIIRKRRRTYFNIPFFFSYRMLQLK
jgi:hypothetical protein